MKNIVKLTFSLVYISLMGLISPIWLGFMYMSITGNGKGYSYDLGSEVYISILSGVLLLILWSISIIPIIWTSTKLRRIHKNLLFIPMGVFLLFSILTISLLGISEVLSWFNL